MRKRLLRSRSGFEKPESREEAIMQNILGASNVLEPSESNIEEILKSILYNTPYTKKAEFEIEKILLAIKNNGTYDGECESRDMKILFAILKDLDYTEEAESRIEELFIEWLHQRSSIKVLEGVPPLTFTARGLPLINYLIEGNTVQSGTPTPDNPIMPQSTGERTENLFSEPLTNGYTLDVTTGLPSTYVKRCATLNPIDVSGLQNVNISFSATLDRTRVIYSLFDNSTLIRRVTAISSGTSINVSDGNKLYICFYDPGDTETVTKNDVTKIMLNKGSTPLPYEPYGYKIPISSASTTTPVYLGEVETTRRVKKLVFDGTENFTKNDVGNPNNYLYYQTDYRANEYCFCTHLENMGTLSTSKVGVFNGNNVLYLNFGSAIMNAQPSGNTVGGLKEYLAAQYANGTPVTIWYVLATEETAVVNEPIRKIGDYADTVSKEQAGVEIPTVNGSNTLDVDTTVKPSNVYIEYK